MGDPHEAVRGNLDKQMEIGEDEDRNVEKKGKKFPDV